MRASSGGEIIVINGSRELTLYVLYTNIRDHAKSDQHFHAMNLHKKAMAKASGQSAISYAPIAHAFLCGRTSDAKNQI